MMMFMPSICFASDSADSLLLHRMWSYYDTYAESREDTEQNVYMVYNFKTEHRNALLFLVPTMYSIAKGDKQYVGEAYCKLKYKSDNEYDLTRQVICGTIPRNRKVMPAMLDFMTPNIYNETLYPDHMLSPFHYANRRFYRYKISYVGSELAIVRIKPKNNNTQLISGHAVVDATTGRVQSVNFEGEFDMIRFNVTALMSIKNPRMAIPERSTTTARFKFLGNRVSAQFTAYYNCPKTLPDSVVEVTDRELMATLRPTPLTEIETKVYDHYDEERLRAAADTTTVKHRRNIWKEIAWDIIGDNLINSQSRTIGGLYMGISPLFNPLYFAFSRSHGFSYRLKAGVQYMWNDNRFIWTNPQIGYNFKQRQFYYSIPLRMTYNARRNGFVEFVFANGNRTNNPKLVEDIQKKVGFDKSIPVFNNEFILLQNNIVLFPWLEVLGGVIYHRRNSFNPQFMRDIGMPSEYRSFSPRISLHFTPWKDGPMLTANYERSIKNVLQSNLQYERWEFDASYKRDLPCMRVLSLRGGAGFYTNRSTDYFVDYENFRDENLPTGWEDEWTGQFQLLNSRWYNESDYYLRAHATYDSPLMALSYLPVVGRFIETERLYLSALTIAHQKPYFEIGYGFTNRLFSTGVFGSILGAKFYQFECKLTIHIFNRW
jgi:hypothetical protein